MILSKETATDIALAHREIETAESLLKQITETIKDQESSDIRDAFGRRVDGLQLGIPSGRDSHRLFHLDWTLAKPVIEAHIAQQKAVLKLLCEKAEAELSGLTGAV